MNDIAALSASFQEFASTVNKRLAMQEEAIGNTVIPAVSRHIAMDKSFNSGNQDFARIEREALGGFLRSNGDQAALRGLGLEAGGFDASVASSMNISSDPAGGYLVTPHLSEAIQRRQADISPIGRLARTVTLTSGDAFEEPVDASEIGAEWVDETEDRPELDTTKLKGIHVSLNEIYTLLPVTQRLLDDTTYNIGSYLEDRISEKFAEKSGQAYVKGTGNKQPEGFLNRASSTDADGVRDYFTLQHKEITLAGFNGGGDTAIDALVDLVYTLRAPYRTNARWLMNSKTAGALRKFRDGEGNLAWANSLAAGQPNLLLGYPVEFDETMPDVGVGNVPIAFGDWYKGYIIVNRPGIRVLVDPYTKKPYVLFYAYTRTGGGVQNGEAIKLLKITANP
ncbi:phage major capsid protein [Metarhizobium album]|nr:phage major capsid protein [Rhizobium album]